MRDAARWAIAVVVAFASAGAAVAQNPDVVFVNHTGVTIYFLYASPTTADSWGEDLLGSTVLPDGGTFRVRLRPAPAIDVRAVDSNDNEYIIWNWRTGGGRRAVIGMDAFVGARGGSDPGALGWLEIWNETNYTVEQIIVVPADTGSWEGGETLLEPWEAVQHGENFRIAIDVERFGTFVYDVMLVDEDGDRYIKWDVNLELIGELEYTLDDIQF